MIRWLQETWFCAIRRNHDYKWDGAWVTGETTITKAHTCTRCGSTFYIEEPKKIYVPVAPSYYGSCESFYVSTINIDCTTNVRCIHDTK